MPSIPPTATEFGKAIERAKNLKGSADPSTKGWGASGRCVEPKFLEHHMLPYKKLLTHNGLHPTLVMPPQPLINGSICALRLFDLDLCNLAAQLTTTSQSVLRVGIIYPLARARLMGRAIVGDIPSITNV